jgi:hypothetical protein
MRLPAFNPDIAVRLDLLLERELSIYGEKIVTLSTAIYIDKDEYKRLKVIDSANDPIIRAIGLLALQHETFEVIDPSTNCLLNYVCLIYSNIKTNRINDTRKKVIRYINPAHSVTGPLSKIYHTNQ